MTASGKVGSAQGVYHGYNVTVVTATAAINVRNGSSTGQIIDVIPTGTAAGSSRVHVDGIALDGGIWLDFNGASGTVVVLYE
jgi:uncharacterized protein YraI